MCSYFLANAVLNRQSGIYVSCRFPERNQKFRLLIKRTFYRGLFINSKIKITIGKCSKNLNDSLYSMVELFYLNRFIRLKYKKTRRIFLVV